MRKIIILLSIFSFVFATNVDFLNCLLTQAEKKEEVYRIEPGDLLEIVILGEEELARTLMVMHNGSISFPLVGEVKVAGLTTDQASEVLATRLEKYFIHPVVSIILQSPTLPYVSVFGEVLRQGAVEYQRGLRVTDYIALAGGPTGTANLGNVRVVRLQTGATSQNVQTINVGQILEGKDIRKNYELKSGDWVYVPRKFTFNWNTIVSTLALAVAIANLYITYDRLARE
jgi:polysaccharide export outer membrane protein